MTDYKTLRVPEDAWEEAKAQKEEHNRTWGKQLVCSSDSTTVENDATIDVEDARLLAEHVERQLAGHFEDLENTLPAKVAEELR